MSALSARDAGIASSFAHANRVSPEWCEEAYQRIVLHAQRNAYLTCIPITAEFPSPTTNKAWGALFVKAQREGVIEKCGYVENPGRHQSPTPMYRSLVYLSAERAES